MVRDLGSQGKKWKAHHWIIERNILERNRWGLYLKHADWIDLASNTIKGSREGDIKDDGDVTCMTIHPPDTEGLVAPRAVLEGPARPWSVSRLRSMPTVARRLRAVPCYSNGTSGTELAPGVLASNTFTTPLASIAWD